MWKRSIWLEGLFAEAKQWHSLQRSSRFEGLTNVRHPGLLIAAGQNLKRWFQATGWGEEASGAAVPLSWRSVWRKRDREVLRRQFVPRTSNRTNCGRSWHLTFTRSEGYYSPAPRPYGRDAASRSVPPAPTGSMIPTIQFFYGVAINRVGQSSPDPKGDMAPMLREPGGKQSTR